MVPSDYVKSQIATLMFNESHDDLIIGMTAAGLVLRNRVQAGWEGGNWLKLIETFDKYHFYPDAVEPRVMKLGNPYGDDLFRRILAIAEVIFDGREKDITCGALYYGRLDRCSEDFKRKIVRQPEAHPRIATVGLKQFFK